MLDTKDFSLRSWLKEDKATFLPYYLIDSYRLFFLHKVCQAVFRPVY